MSNVEIINTECAMRGIFKEVDTYQGWKNRGFQVQKGQKAQFSTKIWKPTKAKDKDGKEQKKLILVTGSFFTVEQVEKIK